MNFKLPCVAAILSGALSAFGTNPGAYEEFQDELKLEFHSPEAARKAELTTAPLYGDKKLAVSARWDDNSGAHVAMAERMRDAGWKGTFYLNKLDEKYRLAVLPKLLDNGCGIGSHSMTHPMLPALNPNDMFQEVLENRIRLEAAADRPVLSFVTPGGSMSLWIPGDQLTTPLLGEALRRGGFIGGPDFGPPRSYGLPSQAWQGGRVIQPGDSATEERFDTVMNDALAKERAERTLLPITVGVHTQQITPKALDVYRDKYRQYGGTPDWWYCEFNEYAAYRYRALHAKIEALEPEGAARAFRVSMIRPREFSTTLPLTFRCSEAIKAASHGGRPLTISPDGHCFDWNGKDGPAAKIDVVENNPESAEFPGIKAALAFAKDANRLTLTLENNSARELSDLTVVFHLPMLWKNGDARFRLEKLPMSGKKTFACDLGEINPEPEFREGVLFFAARVDFRLARQNGRLYAVTRSEQKYSPGDTPRDKALLLGPLPEDERLVASLQALSLPEKKLEDVGTSINEKWISPYRNPRGTAIIVPLFSRDPAWELRRKEIEKEHPKTLTALALDVDAPAGGVYHLRARKDMVHLFLNGNPLLPSYNAGLAMNKGKNRLVVLYPRGAFPIQSLGITITEGQVRHQFLP